MMFYLFVQFMQVVEHSDDLPCRGLFLLHQGIQRRIRITIVHENTPEMKWKDIRELVVGRIRNAPESRDETDDDSCVLSLGLFPGEVMEMPGDDRYYSLIVLLDEIFIIFFLFLAHFSDLKLLGIQVYTIQVY